MRAGVCAGVCVEVGEVCVLVCVHKCFTSENMSPGGDTCTVLNYADCPLSFKVTGHCKWASFLIFP